MAGYFLSRSDLEKQEEMLLAPYAVHSSRSKGRCFPEAEHPYRTAFQRDRDRVIHSGAFRRLRYKTQVFADYENDHFRTRLTHTMEVAQISRTIARSLRLNEDLAEGIALVHDLGHTPFGHAGETGMQEILRDHGGFNHNAQSLRVVEYLEDRYPGFRGLNLTFELREGIVRHETDYDLPALVGFDPSLRASLEGQIVNLADEIAYNAHDVDDGVFSGFVSWDNLRAVPYLDRLHHLSVSAFPDLSEHKRHYHLIRLLIDHAASDLIKHTAGQLEEMGIKTPEEVVHAEKNIVSFSPQGRSDYTELKRFLLDKLYRHPALLETNGEAKRIVGDLFNAYLQQPDLLPDKYRRQAEGLNPHEVLRDYVAGMTDRFAHQEHRRIFGQ